MSDAKTPAAHQPWKTAISDADDKSIRIRGYDITQLMQHATFADTVFLLHQGRMPSEAERRLIDSVLIAVADHGPGSPSAAASRIVASGNRVAPEAAVAAGVLAIGDKHAGAGLECMEIIGEALARARAHDQSIDDAARETVQRAIKDKVRLPGLGHRVHSVDPRTAVLFSQARESGLAGDGIAFMLAVEAAARANIKPLPINIDGALAAVLYDLGFSPLFGKFIFIIGRVAGLTAQVFEEYTREKPMRIRIPVEYDGEPPR
jgi:citrate synthase